MPKPILPPRCPRCGETQPEKFSNDRAKKTKKQTYCKVCSRHLATPLEVMVKRVMRYIERKGK